MSSNAQENAITNLPEFLVPETKKFVEFWFSCCEGGDIPEANNWDLSEVPDLLHSAFIYDLENDDRLVFRYVGPRIVTRVGKEMTGHSYDELATPEIVEETVRDIKKLLAARCGMRVVLLGSLQSAVFSDVESTILPLKNNSSDGHRVVGLAIETSTRSELKDDTITAIGQRIGPDFFDLGFGVPADG